MGRKTVSVIMFSLLLIGMLTLTVNIQPVKASGTIYIRADGTIEGTTDISTVDNVTYTFTDNIYDEIVVERDDIVVDGADYTLSREYFFNGISLSGRSNVTIKNMAIKAFYCGIMLEYSSNNTISGNKITTNLDYGIWLSGSSNNTITGNKITNNEWGILLEESPNNTLRNNDVSNNKYNFGVYGSLLSHYIQDIDDSNTVNNKPIYYWINRREMTIPFDAGYVALINCTDITVQNLNLTNNGQGVLLASTTNSTITKNNITANSLEGIGLHCSSNHNTVSGNTLTKTTYGIQVDGSSNHNIISGNEMTNNDKYGVQLDSSSNNTISGNSMTGNYNYQGITLSHSNCNIISGNKITDYAAGIRIGYGAGSSNTISGNNITNNWSGGIWFWDAGTNNSIIGNNIANSLRGIRVDSSNNTISGNTITTDWIGIDFSGASGNTVSGNSITSYTGISCSWYSQRNSISGNKIINNHDGIFLESSHNTISGNHITNNENGIFNEYSNNVISGNIVTDNQCGIRIYSTTQYSPVYDTTISHNTIKNNNMGIHLTYAKSSDIYHNNFTNNIQQVYIDTPRCANSWDDGYPSGGNYWSDYLDVDLCSGPYQNETGSDGIGDTAYVIDDWNRDRYPLMYPWGAPPSSLYALTISSSPIGVTFTVNGVPHTTPWTGTAIQYTSASLLMPEIHTVGQARYYWDQWSDGNTSRSRTVTMTTNITLTAHYTGPYYQLTVASLPITGIQFTINGAPKTTPYTEWLPEGSYTLEMPETHTVGEAKYYWDQWSDGITSRSRTVTMNTDVTLTAYYTGPNYQLTVTSSPVTGVTFTIDGVPQTTPYTEWLLEGSYTLIMPETHDGYVWSHWLEDGDTNRIKTITLQGTTWTAVYEPAPKPVGGEATPINIPTNKPELQIPCIWLTTIILSLVLAEVYAKKRKRNTRTLPYVKSR